MWLVLMMSLVLLLRLKLVSYLDVGLFAACCCCLGGFLGKSTQLLDNVFQFLIFKCATMPPYSAAWRHTFSIWRMPGILSFFFVCRWNDTNSWQRIWQEFLWGFAMQPAQAPSIIWSWISSGSFLLNWNWTNKASQTNLFIDISLQFNPIWPSLPAYPWTKAWGGAHCSPSLLRDALLSEKCSFFEHCSKGLWPPPLLFEHLSYFAGGVFCWGGN